MYNSPNKSLELATFMRSLRIFEDKIWPCDRKRKRKRAHKSTAPKVGQKKGRTDKLTKDINDKFHSHRSVNQS